MTVFELAELLADALRDRLADAVVDAPIDDGPLFAKLRLRGPDGGFAIVVEDLLPYHRRGERP